MKLKHLIIVSAIGALVFLVVSDVYPKLKAKFSAKPDDRRREA